MTVNWRDVVLKKVTLPLARVRVVADPDGLLLDEDLLHQLDQQGFSVSLYDDPWMFRIRYEEDYRQRWNNGEATAHLLVRSTTMDLDAIPYDIWSQSEPVFLSVSDLFSHLDRTLIADLDRRLYDRAFQVNRAVGSGRLGRAETALRLLRAIYTIDPDLVAHREDVWALITNVHRTGYALSDTLAEFLAERLTRWHREVPVPIRAALTSKNVWEPVLRQASQDGDMAIGARYWLYLLGWDTEIKRQTMQLSPSLNRKLEEFVAQDHIVGRDWLARAEDIATLRLASYLGLKGVDDAVLQAIDDRFQAWVYRDYGLLQSLVPYPEPTMVHHVVHYMAHQKDVSKCALLVIDGMSYLDWLYIKGLMDLSSYHVREQAVFAWVPTITSVSRKAIFSGRIPRDFGQSLGTTSGEELLWQQFWVREQRDPTTIDFVKTADELEPSLLVDSLAAKSIDIVGIVANTVDKLAHAVEMGMKQFLTDLQLWMTDTGWLPTVIADLVRQGFHVVITSDHGHVPVEGMGTPPTGDLPDSKGRRVQVFPSNALRSTVPDEWGEPWPHLSGLPAGYAPLLAPAGKAYAVKGKRLMSHGGVAMEELIVPMIRISQ